MIDAILMISQWANGLAFLFVVVAFLLSIIPSIRGYTGLGMVYATYIWGATFWVFCLLITYSYWGLLGSFIGLFLFGVGVFVTAILAALFSGEGMFAFGMFLNLAIIFGVRMLGVWILSKQK